MQELEPSADPRPSPTDLAQMAARCFAGADGRHLLTYIRAITIERTLGPGIDDAHLRHLEGQRQLVQHLQALIKRGRMGPVTNDTNLSETAD